MPVILPQLAEQSHRKTAEALHQIAQGRTNSAGSFTLSSTGATQTTISNPCCAIGSGLWWQPTTANAAAQMATLWCTGGSTGQFVVNYSSSTSTDAIFNYEVRG